MQKDHPKIEYGKTGVLLINLGTPDSTSWWDIRKYLKEFLSDKRVIEVNPVIWQVILNLFWKLNLRVSLLAFECNVKGVKYFCLSSKFLYKLLLFWMVETLI